MKNLYWFSVLDGFKDVCITAMIILIVTVVVLLITYIVMVAENENDSIRTKIGKMTFKMFAALCITSLFVIFVPSKNDMYVIYGVGKTLDYLKENPDAKNLPDKTVEFLNVVMDEYIDEHKKNDDNQ